MLSRLSSYLDFGFHRTAYANSVFLDQAPVSTEGSNAHGASRVIEEQTLNDSVDLYSAAVDSSDFANMHLVTLYSNDGMAPPIVNVSDPSFWIPLCEPFPQGWNYSLTESERLALDHSAWLSSAANALGISFEDYVFHIDLERTRQVEQNSAYESLNNDGSYYFSLEPSARVSAPYISREMASSFAPARTTELQHELGRAARELLEQKTASLDEIKQALDRLGFALRRVAHGPGQNAGDSPSNVIVNQPTRFEAVWVGSLKALPGFDTTGQYFSEYLNIQDRVYTQGYTTPIYSQLLERHGIQNTLLTPLAWQHIFDRHFSGNPATRTSQFDPIFGTPASFFARILVPTLGGADRVTRQGSSFVVETTLPYDVGVDQLGRPTSTVRIVLMPIGRGTYSVVTAYPISAYQIGGN